MPTYEYECKNCGHSFEAFQSMSEAPLRSCPQCGREEARRLIKGGGGIIFKGSGFYATDRARGDTKTASTGGKDAPPAKKSEACASCPVAESGACGGAEKKAAAP